MKQKDKEKQKRILQDIINSHRSKEEIKLLRRKEPNKYELGVVISDLTE